MPTRISSPYIAPLHRQQRELQILILNPQLEENLYRTVVQKYPNAQITTIGDTERDTSDGSTHLRIRFQNMSEYTLHATLGSPRIDLMIINPPKLNSYAGKPRGSALFACK